MIKRETRWKVCRRVPGEMVETRLNQLSEKGWDVKTITERYGLFTIVACKRVRVP